MFAAKLAGLAETQNKTKQSYLIEEALTPRTKGQKGPGTQHLPVTIGCRRLGLS